MKLSKGASTMVLNLSLMVVASSAATAAATTTGTTDLVYSYDPPSIDFSDLVNEGRVGSPLRQALSESGLIVLRNVPGLSSSSVSDSETHDQDKTREEWGPALVDCLEALENPTKENSREDDWKPRKTPYEDGSVRTTLAFDPNDDSERTSTTATDSRDNACALFRSCRTKLQTAIDHAVATVAEGLDSATGDQNPPPPLLTRRRLHDDATTIMDDYHSVSDLVQHATLIDHFHSYTVPTTTRTDQQQKNRSQETKPTIEMHTDLGLFVAFLPGRIVPSAGTTTTEIARDFFLELRDGRVAKVVFEDQNNDDLVIMLGVEAERILNKNNHNRRDQDDSNNDPTNGTAANLPFLRAPPHSVRIKRKDTDEQEEEQDHRVWYGRMVLPPADAHVAAAAAGLWEGKEPSNDDGSEKIMTYGELRRQMIAATAAGEEEETAKDGSASSSLRIGCFTSPGETLSSSSSSSLSSTTARTARELQDNCVEGEELFCWHRCMAITDPSTVSEQACTERNLSLECVQNGTGTLWNGDHADASYQPACYERQEEEMTEEEEAESAETSADTTSDPTLTPPATTETTTTTTSTSSAPAKGFFFFFGGTSNTPTMSSLLILLTVVAGVMMVGMD